MSKAEAIFLGNRRMNVKKQVDDFVENAPSTLPPQIPQQQHKSSQRTNNNIERLIVDNNVLSKIVKINEIIGNEAIEYLGLEKRDLIRKEYAIFWDYKILIRECFIQIYDDILENISKSRSDEEVNPSILKQTKCVWR